MSARRNLLLVVLAEVLAATTVVAQTNVSAGGAGAPPPSAAAKRSQADLEKLIAPIALYPDPLIATVLPASAYPLEIVQAARFVKDTNNIAKLDAQPWDENVKAVARFPDVIAQMNDNIAWTSDLGDAFINQPKELTDAVQTMRSKAQTSGALKTTPQQVVTVTNTVETNVVQQKTVYVTNQVVQIQPAQPDVIYVPQYNPTVVYAGYPAYPGYYYPPYPPPGSVAAASIVSFGVGMAMGAIVANNCDWHGGGVYVGPRGGVYAGGWGHGDVDVNVNRNVNVNQSAAANRANVNRSSTANNANVQNRSAQSQKWQPDQSRLKNSGSTASTAQNREARGWSSASAQGGAGSARAGAGSTGAQTGTAAGQGRSTTPGGDRSAATPSGNRPTPSGDRASATPGGDRAAATPSGNRPSTTPSGSRTPSQAGSTPRTAGGAGSASQSSAFSGMQNGTAERSASQRGSMSRSGGSAGAGGGAAAGARAGGGARGGGGRR